MYRLGIDVGGTNTDFVLLDEQSRIVSMEKRLTTKTIEEGIIEGILALGVDPSMIRQIYVGTTHALNALLEAKGLLPTGLIRMAGHNPKISPGAGIPQRLKDAFFVGGITVSGGFECDGREISPCIDDELLSAVDSLVLKGAKGIAIVSTFGCIYPLHEQRAYEIIRQHYLDQLQITLSSSFGSIGFIERENATVINTALFSVIDTGFSQLQTRLSEITSAELFLVQNDGSQVTFDEAKKMPILTLSCGPTNSGKGGSILTKNDSCIVVDVGGTSTDVIRVEKRFVKRSAGNVSIADLSLQFSAPDVVSLAIGGGSIVVGDLVGPQSVASSLKTKALCFGGDIETLTDLAIQTGRLAIQGADSSKVLASKDDAEAILAAVSKRIADAITLVRGEMQDLPCVLVGGGAPIIEKSLRKLVHNLRELDETRSYGIANALGAIHSEVSGASDRIISFDDRERLLPELIDLAKERAIAKGAAREEVRVGDIIFTPFAYSKDRLAKITISVAGPRKRVSYSL